MPIQGPRAGRFRGTCHHNRTVSDTDGASPPDPPGDPLSPADEDRLRRELADLEAYLEEHGDEDGDRALDVDIAVRRRKAEVLRGVLDEDDDGPSD